MIDKQTVEGIVAKWLQDKEYFLTDIQVSESNSIVVEIDHAQGVWIDDCAALSQYIEQNLDREQEDYELEVGSAGIGQPFKVHQQYINHLGEDVEVLLYNGAKLQGKLSAVEDANCTVTCLEKVKEEGAKRPKVQEVAHTLPYADIKSTKLIIRF